MMVVDIHCRCHGEVTKAILVDHAETYIAELIQDCPPDEFPEGLFATEPYEVDSHDLTAPQR